MKARQFVQRMIHTQEYIDIGNEVTDDVNNLMPLATPDSYIMKKTLFGIHNSSVVFMRHCNNLDIMPHSHDFIEIQYISAGTIRQDINGTPISLHAGTLLVFSKGTTHSVFRAHSDACMDYILLHERIFDENMLRLVGKENAVYSLANNADNGEYLCVQNLDSRLLNLLSELRSEAKSNLIDHDRLEYLLLGEIFIRIDRLIKAFEGNPNRISSAEKTISSVYFYISNNYRNPSLKELAEQLHMNQSYLCRIIKTMTGKTFTDLVADARLDAAKTLLLYSNLSIESIAAMVGYASPTFLYKLFQRKHNITPSSFRTAGKAEMSQK